MNVGVYGGSFDPPHLGHIMVLMHLLLNEGEIDRILIVPCFQQVGKALTPYSHRMEMAEDAFKWLPRVEISDIEYRLGGDSISSRMIRALRTEQPDWKLRFIMGSDLLTTAPNWSGWDYICENAPPLPIGRAGISPVAPGQPEPISAFVSSTIIREALAKGDFRTAERYLPTDVLAYIQANCLYTPQASWV